MDFVFKLVEFIDVFVVDFGGVEFLEKVFRSSFEKIGSDNDVEEFSRFFFIVL